ncbi:high-affinity iron permease [Globomyces sp. JEL0801]|nr:high-affinity iron permease [Globomyces sp. JEL0801]
MPNLFSIPMFFVIFRETLEAALVVSILLGFIGRLNFSSTLSIKGNTALRSRLKRLVISGTIIAMLITFVVGGVFIALFYIYGQNFFESAELLWEGVFSAVACLAITITAFAMLQTHSLSKKLEKKIAGQLLVADTTESDPSDAMLPQEGSSGLKTPVVDTSAPQLILANEQSGLISKFTSENGNQNYLVANDDSTQVESDEERNSSTYSLTGVFKAQQATEQLFFWIPFVTVLREGIEAMLFVGGVAISEEPSAVPLAVIVGLIAGISVGVFVHYGGSKMTLHYFYIFTSYLLFVMSAGLCARAVGFFEDYDWSKKSAMDADRPDALFFNPMINVWVLPDLSEKSASIWPLMNAVFGWRSIATYGTVIGYCVYWLVVTLALVVVRVRKNSQTKQLTTE